MLIGPKQVLGILNAGPWQKRDLSHSDFGFERMGVRNEDQCLDPIISHQRGTAKETQPKGRIVRRQSYELTPGYVTVDDFGDDGDDTAHSPVPYYPQPNDIQGNASFPTDGSDPQTVDLIFTDFIGSYVLDALAEVGGNYSKADIQNYLPPSFSTNSYLPEYARREWQANMPDCPIG